MTKADIREYDALNMKTLITSHFKHLSPGDQGWYSLSMQAYSAQANTPIPALTCRFVTTKRTYDQDTTEFENIASVYACLTSVSQPLVC